MAQKSSLLLRNFSANLELAIAPEVAGGWHIRGLAVKIQKLNSRGSVDQVMKEVKKRAA